MKAAVNIRNCLAAMTSGDFPTRAAELLTEIGYRSTRTLPGQSGDVDAFLVRFPATNPDTQSEQAFRENANSAWLLFQLTDTEIETSAQGILFDSNSFAESNVKSFLFVAVELKDAQYSRGQYTAFTREINKRLSQPAVGPVRPFYEENKLWSWEPPVLGSRIVAQSSVFVFGVPAIPSPKMKKLTISAASKNSILGELETAYGINEEELFPDFSGYAVANSSKKAFDVARTIEYWKEQIDSAKGDDEKAMAHLRCGVAFSAMREHGKAIRHYDKAICLNPQNAAAYDNRGTAKGELGQHDKAITDYDEALRIDPQYVKARFNREIAKGKLRQASSAE